MCVKKESGLGGVTGMGSSRSVGWKGRIESRGRKERRKKDGG